MFSPMMRLSLWGPALFGTGGVAEFTPTSLFSSDTGGWWDPSDMTTLFQDSAGTTPCTAAGDPVGRINDKSGNGNNLVNASAPGRPTLRNSGALWWLEFDGTGHSLAVSATLNQPVTRVTAARQVSWTAGDRMWCGFANNNAALFQDSVQVSPYITMYAGARGPAQATEMVVGTDFVVTEIFNGASSKLAINNNAYTTGDTGAANPAGSNVGGYGPSQVANILWYGAVHIGRVLTDPEIANCRTYFGEKSGLTL